MSIRSDKPKKSKRMEDESYKNDAYWSLPENVRAAIDKAQNKNGKSQFYY
jgi:hypothetical protein